MEHNPQQRVHAFGDDALGDHDAVGIADQIRTRRVSPLEVVEAAISRIEQVDPTLNALACRDFDRAREQAHEQGRGLDAGGSTGFFAGVPGVVKDNSDVAGLPTQQGTRSFRAAAAADGDYARMFRQQGLVNIGKSQLSEFGFSASAEFSDGTPPVRNPWHTSYTSGASSAGSAALVARGALPIAHANDGGGSIRIPAAACGLVGMKPTRGRVPQDRMLREMPVRIVADGVVTRSVRDTAAFLRESEKIYRRLELPPIGDIRGPGHKRLRIGVVVDSVDRESDFETAQTVRGAAKLLESLGHHVEEIDAPVPEFFVADFLTYWSLLAGHICLTGKRTLDPSFDRHRVDNLTAGLAGNALRRSYRLPLAIARLAASKRVSARFFRSYDAVLTPTLGRVTPEIGWLDPGQPFDTIMERLLEWVTFTPLQNATGDPAISLPLGRSSQGLPIGVQLAASQGHEARLLRVAYELEEASPFARIRDREQAGDDRSA
jgi:amidase